MPRINELKPQYMAKDIGARVKGLMFRANVTETALARELGITQGGLHYKLKNNVFNYKELVIIFHETGASKEEVLELMMI